MAVSERVRELFLRELAGRGVSVKAVLEDGRYSLALGTFAAKVNLENLARDFEVDHDEGRVRRFVDTILSSASPIPGWPEARAGLRFAAEAADGDFGDAIHEPVSESLCRSLVHVSPDEMRITWVTPAILAVWGIDRQEAETIAGHNMAELLRQTTIEVETIEQHRLGMFATRSPFKASLIFSPNLEEVVGSVLGWPLIAVIPCRDFAYVFGEEDSDLIPRVGSVVLREYQERGYPISTEVYRISAEGIEAIGKFQPAPPAGEAEEANRSKRVRPEEKRGQAEEHPDKEEQDDLLAEGMKTIHYRGGVMCFRLPEHWEEEYEEEGGGTFYDPDLETGALRVNVMTLSSKEHVGPASAVGILEQLPMTAGRQVEALPDGNALVAYSEGLQQEEDDGLFAWYWLIGNPVPPHHLRIAIFTYTAAADQADDPDVIEQAEMLDRELRQCRFAAEIGEVED